MCIRDRAMASPLGRSPLKSRSAVDAAIETVAAATALRWVGVFSPTSTMCTWPSSSRWFISSVIEGLLAGSGFRPSHHLEFNGAPGFHAVGADGDDGERVGERQCGENVGGLTARPARMPQPCAVAFGHDPHEHGLLWVRGYPVVENRCHAIAEQPVGPHHREQSGAHELFERDEHRDRVPRQAEERDTAHGPKSQRLARLHRDPQEVDGAAFTQRELHNVVGAHRYTAARHDHVCCARAFIQSGSERLGVVWNDSEIDDLDAEFGEQPCDQGAVGVADDAGVEDGSRWWNEFVAGRHDRNDWTPPDKREDSHRCLLYTSDAADD